MDNNTKILAAGGDKRQLWCVRELNGTPGITARAAGFDTESVPPELIGLTQWRGEQYDCLLLSMNPFDGDGKVKFPCSGDRISEDELSDHLIPGRIVLSGGNERQTDVIFPGSRVICYGDREELCLRNAVLTAEGAVQLALEELDEALWRMPVLVAGIGRIGTALIKILSGFGAKISAVVRNDKGAAKAEAVGAYPVGLSGSLSGYSLIFNTVPDMVFDSEVLRGVDKDTVIIDLASAPGGTDFTAAAGYGIRAVHAPGLPGRTAPVTAGKIIAGTVINILKEVRENE